MLDELYWQSWNVEKPRAVIVILHSLGDHSGRYQHVVDHLVPFGFSIYAFDLRGHGRSKGQKGHVEKWNDYREDLQVFISHVKQLESVDQVVLLGQGMGALMALDFGIRKKDQLQGVVSMSAFLSMPKVLKESLIEMDLSSLLPHSPLEFNQNFAALTRDSNLLDKITNDPLVHFEGSSALVSEVLSLL